ncbi:MAG: tail fiber domain-containing protein [Halioglobus sp.]
MTTGGVWTNASSRELKDNIETLSTEDANEALAGLSPVRYVYKNSRDEEYVGFIAEDVPELVATNDHKSLSPMDIVAVLTTVAKEQKEEISTLRDTLAQQASTIQKQEAVSRQQEERILQMEMALAEVLRNQSSENQVGLRD